MKRQLSMVFAALLCLGAVIPVSAQADTDNFHNDRPHLVWVHRHFIRVHDRWMVWVPGHPGVR